MFYTIYKTTNLINHKYYLGKHQTKDLNDGYLGSGKLLKRAITKYGRDNFHKEVLHICNTEKQMDILEKILVVPDVELNYNICAGGKGGFSYINEIGANKKTSFDSEKGKKANKKLISRRLSDDQFNKQYLKTLSASAKRRGMPNQKGEANYFYGKTHSAETKLKMSIAAKNRKPIVPRA